VSLVPSTGDKYILRDGSSFDLTNGGRECDLRKVQRRRQYSQNVNSHDLLVNDRQQRWIFRESGEGLTPFQKVSHTERIDIVFGSVRRGQTHLFWKGDQLLELPVSYWTELDGWINSPRFPDGSPRFDKPVLPRCLECHSGRFEPLPQSENSYDPGSLVLGIPCERCHGPGREHVLFPTSKIALRSGMEDPIVNPAFTFPRPANRYLCFLSRALASLSLLLYPLPRETRWRIMCTFRIGQTLLLMFMATRPNCWSGAAVFRAAP